MNLSALQVLVCPFCREALEVHARHCVEGEVLDGLLVCAGCEAEFPVRQGVPRFVAEGDYASSFGYQWNRFRAVQLDSCNGRDESERSFHTTTGWSDEELKGKLVLDAGVGAGRYAEVVAKKGGEVFGVDLTEAVDAAYLSIGGRAGVHLAQADLFALPFRDQCFDFVYSIGVLHHTPDPRAAFARLAAAVRPGGRLAIYVYPHPGLARHFPDLIRRITTRLPLRLMFLLSSLAVPLFHLYRLPGIGKVLHLLCPISMHPDWRTRWLDTFDWYTPRYQWKLRYPEVFRWFRENGFGDIELLDEPIRVRGVRTPGIPAHAPGASRAPSKTRPEPVAVGFSSSMPLRETPVHQGQMGAEGT